MTHGTWLALRSICDNKIKAGTTSTADAETLHTAKQKLDHALVLNFSDEGIVNEINDAKTLLEGLP